MFRFISVLKEEEYNYSNKGTEEEKVHNIEEENNNINKALEHYVIHKVKLFSMKNDAQNINIKNKNLYFRFIL